MNESQAKDGMKGALALLGLMFVLLASWFVWTTCLSPDDVQKGMVDSANQESVALGVAGVVAKGDLEERPIRTGAEISFVGSAKINGGYLVRRKALEFGLTDGRSVAVEVDAEGRFEFSVIEPGEALEVRVPFLTDHPAIKLDIGAAKPPSHDLGTIVLGEGMSGVIIEATGIQTLDVTEFWAGLRTLKNGKNDKLITSGKIKDPENDEQVILRVPAQVMYRRHMGVGNLFPEFLEGGSTEPMLALSEWRLHTIDMSEVVSINPRLMEIPHLALDGLLVNLRHLGDVKEAFGSRWRICTSDKEGRVKILDRFDGKYEYTAFIKTFDLKEVRLLGEGKSSVIDVNTKTLAPIHGVVGLVRLDAQSEPMMAEKWALDCSHPSGEVVGSFWHGVKLIREGLLDDKTSEFAFRNPQGGRYPFSRADLIEVEPGLYGIPEPAAAPKSTLIVRSETGTPSELELVVVDQASGKKVRSGAMKPDGDGYIHTSEELDPGSYELHWRWRAGRGGEVGRAVEGSVRLTEGATVEVTVVPPQFRTFEGHFQNWGLIAAADTPVLVKIGGRTARVKDAGRFELEIAVPVPEKGDAVLGVQTQFMKGVVDVIEVGVDDRLTVSLNLDGVVRTVVSVDTSRRPDELGVRCWIQERGVEAVLQHPWGASWPRLDKNGTATISTTRDKVIVGSVWEFVYGFGTPSVLGFFEVDPSESSTVMVKLEGRPVRVELAQESETNTTNITVIWRSPKGMTMRCPVHWLAKQGSPAFWCPNTAVEIEFERDGAIQRISDWTGDRIALSAW